VPGGLGRKPSAYLDHEGTVQGDVIVSGEHGQLEFELIALRGRAECLEQDLSDALHLLHSMLVCLSAAADSDLGQRAIAMFRAKIFQMPQGFRVGQRLIELDEQFGGLLESKGMRLERWVYESRWKSNA
jgi:hypothetical protein